MSLSIIEIPKEIESRVWVGEYLKELSQLSTEELIDTTLSAQVPDDYDGCWTTRGYWKAVITKIVLKNRVLGKD